VRPSGLQEVGLRPRPLPAGERSKYLANLILPICLPLILTQFPTANTYLTLAGEREEAQLRAGALQPGGDHGHHSLPDYAGYHSLPDAAGYHSLPDTAGYHFLPDTTGYHYRYTGD
jgi:hypothetical protein